MPAPDPTFPWGPLALVILLGLPACVPVSPPTPRPIVERWKGPVIHKGTPFYFEIAPDEDVRMILPSSGSVLLGIAGDVPRGLEYRFASYHVLGRKLDLHPGVPTYVYRPPGAKPWKLKEGRLVVRWDGEADRPVVVQRDQKQSMLHVGFATIVIRSDGRVRYRAPGSTEDVMIAGPSRSRLNLDLDARGERKESGQE